MGLFVASARKTYDMGHGLLAIWRRGKDPRVLDAAIDKLKEALAMPWPAPARQLACAVELAQAFSERLRLRADDADTDNLINLLSQLIEVPAMNRPWLYHLRGHHLLKRYIRHGTLADLDNAVMNMKQAYNSGFKSGKPETYRYAIAVAHASELRFDRLKGRLSDVASVEVTGLEEHWRGPRDLVVPITMLTSLLAGGGLPSLGPIPSKWLAMIKCNLANLLNKYAIYAVNRPLNERDARWARAIELLQEALYDALAESTDDTPIVSSLLSALETGETLDFPSSRDMDPALRDRLNTALQELASGDIDPAFAAATKLNLAALYMRQGRISEALEMFRKLSSSQVKPVMQDASVSAVQPMSSALTETLRAAERWMSAAFMIEAWDQVVEAFSRVAELTNTLRAGQLDWSARYAWTRSISAVSGEAAFAFVKLGRASEAAAVLHESRALMLAEPLNSDLRIHPASRRVAGLSDDSVGTTLYLVPTTAGSMALCRGDGDKWSEVWLPELSFKSLYERVLRYIAAFDAFKRDAELAIDSWMSELSDILDYLRVSLRPLIQALPQGDLTVIPTGMLAVLPVAVAFLDGPPERGISILPASDLRPSAGPQIGDNALIVADQKLPWADWERTAVSGFFSRPAAPSGDASPQAVLDAIPPHGVVHFACHGSSGYTSPLEDRLYLPGGKLTVRSILDAQLPPVSLIVLSACETGVPDPYALDENIGLSTVFLAATKANVVSTLWRVDDLSAALLCLRFYWELHFDDVSGSLALARAQWWQASTTDTEKCAFIEDDCVQTGVIASCIAEVMTEEFRRNPGPKGSNSFEHPFYWAAFTYSGR